MDNFSQEELYCLIKKYKRINKTIESKFCGLPHAQSFIVNLLINLADPETGIVSEISYYELSNLLKINPAPGRKNSGTPTKQTIRNWVKSIERDCGDYFKIITEGQNLRFQFTEMPQIFKEVFQNKEVNTVTNTTTPPKKTEQNYDFDEPLNIEVNTEDNTHNPAVKNINIFNITNSNKQNRTANNDFSRNKKPIGDDFYPNTKTIEIAFSMGLTKITDKEEIQAFIKHNKKQNTQWADFNPVFINWLERDAQYAQNKQQKAQGQLRSHHNERGTNQSTLHQTALERVSEHHGISIDSLWDKSDSELNSGAFIEGTLVQPLDEADSDLRSTFYQ
ncbi:Vir protein [Legionella pneumophila serogroup 1]|uniref:Vir protein n=1 Tax=Legionella pneumophila TaxID=446 RepID=UPI0039C02593|nr:Vir protein [Legionella pneumophila subsp. pneumophila]